MAKNEPVREQSKVEMTVDDHRRRFCRHRGGGACTQNRHAPSQSKKESRRLAEGRMAVWRSGGVAEIDTLRDGKL